MYFVLLTYPVAKYTDNIIPSFAAPKLMSLFSFVLGNIGATGFIKDDITLGKRNRPIPVQLERLKPHWTGWDLSVIPLLAPGTTKPL